MTISSTTLIMLLAAGVVAIYLHATGQTPLIIDVAFVALLLWRPSLPALALLIVQFAARRWPPSARGLAAFSSRQLPSWAASVALPGASTAARAAPSAPARPATGQTTALPASKATGKPAAQVAPLAHRAWMERVNAALTYPHLAVVGGTRLGKTTIVQALLTERPGYLVICTPKSEEEDPWAGFPAVRTIEVDGDTSYAPIGSAVALVYQEMNARRHRNTTADESITLVLDEFSADIDEIPELRRQIIRLWAMGAGVGIRVIVIDPEVNVRAWGIDGRGDIRSSLLILSVDDDRRWSIGRWGKVLDPIDSRYVLDLARAADLSARAWPGLAAAPIAVPAVPVSDSRQTADGRRVSDETLEWLYLVKGIHDREDARKWLRQHLSQGLDNTRWSDLVRRLEAGQPVKARTV